MNDKPNNIPNLFSFATKELSQDAFIAWLVSWADIEYKLTHPEIHKAGLSLLNLLSDKQICGAELKVKAILQWNKIDIRINVDDVKNNKSYVIVVEDKINAGHRFNQLLDYKKIVENDVNLAGKNKIFTYLKTGEPFIDQYFRHTEKWHKVNRSQLLKVLMPHKDAHDFIKEYCSYFEAIETNYQSWTNYCIDSNPKSILFEGKFEPCWGFYNAIHKRVIEHDDKDSHSVIVNTPSGGFAAFCFDFNKIDNVNDELLYLQIDQRNILTIRAGIWSKPYGSDNAKDKAEKFRQAIIKSLESNLYSLNWEYARSNRGVSRRVIEYSGFIKRNNEGHIDIDETAEVLKKAQTDLKIALGQIQ